MRYFSISRLLGTPGSRYVIAWPFLMLYLHLPRLMAVLSTPLTLTTSVPKLRVREPLLAPVSHCGYWLQGESARKSDPNTLYSWSNYRKDGHMLARPERDAPLPPTLLQILCFAQRTSSLLIRRSLLMGNGRKAGANRFRCVGKRF